MGIILRKREQNIKLEVKKEENINNANNNNYNNYKRSLIIKQLIIDMVKEIKIIFNNKYINLIH